VLVLLLLWPLAAFGGRGASTAFPFAIGCVIAAVFLKPSPARSQHTRRLEVALLAIAAFTIVQIVPLPVQVASLLSPHADVFRSALSLRVSPARWAPLSIDPRSTAWACAVTIAATALYFAGRAAFGRGGLRQTVRGISALGLIVSGVAVAQAATAGRSIYWRFPTEYEGPLPFGPFVNRNHFATWVIMAAPLCIGYIAARAGRGESVDPAFLNRRARLARALDGRTAWLAAAGAVMIVALLLSMSRSGILSLLIASALTAAASRRRRSRSHGWIVAALVVLTVGMALTRVDMSALADRFGRSGSSVADRLRIWRDTVPIVRDFWLTGTGVGTFQTAMLYYQQSDRLRQFNQAHNHFLQAAAEGGLVLLALVGFALAALARSARERLAGDISGAYWIRAGAVCGLLAVALQSVWETGLTMPANAALAAILAAIATHER
jgi:putative inorganic carbon (hco3(-)) transporter